MLTNLCISLNLKLQLLLHRIGAWKANPSNQVQGLHTLIGITTMWAAAHFHIHWYYTWSAFAAITAYLEFYFDPFEEPHPAGSPYDPDIKDFIFYQLGAAIGLVTLILFTHL